jgi:hypothetical protein
MQVGLSFPFFARTVSSGPETVKPEGLFCFTVAAIGNKRGFQHEIGLKAR